jgi:hypothetical protein
MTTALTFNGITLSPIPHQNSPWIRSVELARALGYSSEKSVSNIYNRNQDEFSNDMSVVINLSTTDTPAPSRIFSLRGCHLVAMFARTPVAKAFRRWVLDVLDKLDAEQRAASSSPTPDDFTGTLSITPSSVADRKPLRALVGSWAQVSGLPFAACWNQLKAAFNLANIKELPQEWIPDAIDWVQKRIDALPAPAPATALPASPSSPTDDAEGHLAAIREHIRQIHRHEEALFLLARRALPAARKPGDMFSPARRTGLTAFQSMEDCAGALDYSLRALESSARTMLTLGR